MTKPTPSALKYVTLGTIVILTVYGGWYLKEELGQGDLKDLVGYTWIDPTTPFDPDKVLFENEPVSTLLRTLVDGTVFERESAALGLVHVHHGCDHHTKHSGWSPPALEVRARAIRAVARGALGTRAKVIVPALREALNDQSSKVRKMAALALKTIGPESASAFEKLQDCLEDPVEDVRREARHALMTIR